MARRFGRVASLQVINAAGIFSLESGATGLRIHAEVTKTLEPAANTAKIDVYNLSKTSRDILAKKVKTVVKFNAAQRAMLQAIGSEVTSRSFSYSEIGMASVELRAGYEGGDEGLIFEGEAQRTDHDHSGGTEWRTTLMCNDSATGIREGKLNKTFPPGIEMGEVVADLVRSMGVRITPVTKSILTLALTRVGASAVTFPMGYTASGKSWSQIQQILEFVDVKWSIQDGEFVILAEDGSLGSAPIPVGVETGMIGSPRDLEDGKWEVRSLLDHRIKPGGTVSVTSKYVDGVFRVDQARYTVDTGGSGLHAVTAIVSPLEPYG